MTLLTDIFSRNERRTFESLSDLEKQIKSSVKRFHHQIDDVVDKNVDNKTDRLDDKYVEKFVDDFESRNDIIEQERRRQRVKEVRMKLFKYLFVRTCI